jgi:hypothetical protein
LLLALVAELASRSSLSVNNLHRWLRAIEHREATNRFEFWFFGNRCKMAQDIAVTKSQ